MAKNVSALDRAIRIVVGVGLVALTLAGPAAPWGWVGLVALLTGAVGSCPLYQLVGISTKGTAKSASPS